ncbi:MAG: hypothetical protein V4558_15085 [Gemmatimonadota bacterium]
MNARYLPALVGLALFALPLTAQTTPTAPAASSEPAPVPKLTPEQEAHFLALGKTYNRWFLTGKADSLLQVIAPETIEKVGGIDGLRTMMNQIAERVGVETAIVEEKMTRRNGRPQFWHAGLFSEMPDDQVVLRWILDANGKITGVGAGPLSKAPAPDPN